MAPATPVGATARRHSSTSRWDIGASLPQRRRSRRPPGGGDGAALR